MREELQRADDEFYRRQRIQRSKSIVVYLGKTIIIKPIERLQNCISKVQFALCPLLPRDLENCQNILKNARKK